MQLSEVWIRNYTGSVSYPKKVAPLHPSKFGNVQGKCFHICWSFCHFRSSTSPCPEGSFLAPEISRLFGDTVGASLVRIGRRLHTDLSSKRGCENPIWYSAERSVTLYNFDFTEWAVLIWNVCEWQIIFSTWFGGISFVEELHLNLFDAHRALW